MSSNVSPINLTEADTIQELNDLAGRWNYVARQAARLGLRVELSTENREYGSNQPYPHLTVGIYRPVLPARWVKFTVECEPDHQQEKT